MSEVEQPPGSPAAPARPPRTRRGTASGAPRAFRAADLHRGRRWHARVHELLHDDNPSITEVEQEMVVIRVEFARREVASTATRSPSAVMFRISKCRPSGNASKRPVATAAIDSREYRPEIRVRPMDSQYQSSVYEATMAALSPRRMASMKSRMKTLLSSIPITCPLCRDRRARSRRAARP